MPSVGMRLAWPKGLPTDLRARTRCGLLVLLVKEQEARPFGMPPPPAPARSAQARVASNPSLGSEAAKFLAQAELVREIFGNPIRAVSLDQSWLTPNVLKLAVAIYDERAFNKMGIFADALDNGECDDTDVVAHLREPGPHVRGC